MNLIESALAMISKGLDIMKLCDEPKALLYNDLAMVSYRGFYGTISIVRGSTIFLSSRDGVCLDPDG